MQLMVTTTTSANFTTSITTPTTTIPTYLPNILLKRVTSITRPMTNSTAVPISAAVTTYFTTLATLTSISSTLTTATTITSLLMSTAMSPHLSKSVIKYAIIAGGSEFESKNYFC